MSATCQCLEDNISLEFPTTHVDGTARIQIVKNNSSLDKLLSMLEPKLSYLLTDLGLLKRKT